MANPQTKEGFVQLANELWDATLYHKFTARQQKIIKLIVRMSYGCQKKHAIIPLFNFFELCGVRLQDAKKEILILCEANVIAWDMKTKYRLNKNYDNWKIERVSGWNSELYKKLLHENLKVTKSVTEAEQQSYEKCNSEEGESYEKCNSGVTESVTMDLHKVLLPKPDSLSVSKVGDTPKDSIKDSIKDIKLLKTNVEVLFKQFYEIYPRKISYQATVKAWNKLSKESTFNPERIIEQTLNFAETCRRLETATQFIPHPSTFLNQRRFEEYDFIDPEGLAAAKETKFDSNFDFLRGQIGGGGNDQGRGCLNIDEGDSGLPE